MKLLFMIGSYVLLLSCIQQPEKISVFHEGYSYDKALKKETMRLTTDNLKRILNSLEIEKKYNQTCDYIYISYGKRQSRSDFRKIKTIDIHENETITITYEPTKYKKPSYFVSVINYPYQIVEICK